MDVRNCPPSNPKHSHNRTALRQGSNALNRSMQGLWSAHRKAKLNLNAIGGPAPPVPPAPTSAPTPASPPQSVSESTDATAHQDGLPIEEPMAEAGPSPGTSQTDLDPSLTTRPPSSKRKLRTTRSVGADESSKRPKVGT
ncbi:hypothetical protein PAXINDRAFT_103753, partial [Paxillus involutus ATCC 200175]